MVGFSGHQPFHPEATWPYPLSPTTMGHFASINFIWSRVACMRNKRLRKPKDFWSFESGAWDKDLFFFFFNYTITLKFGSDGCLLFKAPTKSETGRIPFYVLLTVKVQQNYADVNVSSYRSVTFTFGWDHFKCFWHFVIMSERNDSDQSTCWKMTSLITSDMFLTFAVNTMKVLPLVNQFE